jgi:hypothetical protein
MRTVAILLLVAAPLGVAACRPTRSATPVSDPGAPVEAPFGGGSTPTQPVAPTAADCAGGKPGQCAATGFVTQSLCFETAEAACACAGCKADACLIAESGPAQVSCK